MLYGSDALQKLCKSAKFLIWRSPLPEAHELFCKLRVRVENLSVSP